MTRWYWIAGLFNFVWGCLLFFVLALWFMSFIYIAQGLGLIMDATLDEGLLPVFLILSAAASLIHFPLLFLCNKAFLKEMGLHRGRYLLFSGVMLSSGLLFIFMVLYQL